MGNDSKQDTEPLSHKPFMTISHDEFEVDLEPEPESGSESESESQLESESESESDDQSSDSFRALADRIATCRQNVRYFERHCVALVTGTLTCTHAWR